MAFGFLPTPQMEKLAQCSTDENKTLYDKNSEDVGKNNLNRQSSGNIIESSIVITKITPTLPFPSQNHKTFRRILFLFLFLFFALTAQWKPGCSLRLMRGSRLAIMSTSPSTSTTSLSFGVTASITKWLSQCGQYSSVSGSKSFMSLRKHRWHFLHMNTISMLFFSGWSGHCSA